MTIELPAGFALDNADAPVGINGGEISKYDVKIGVTTDGRTLVYKREFFFGGGQTGLLYPVTSYAQLKQLFDEVHKRDNHMLSLKQGATTAAATGAPSN